MASWLQGACLGGTTTHLGYFKVVKVVMAMMMDVNVKVWLCIVMLNFHMCCESVSHDGGYYISDVHCSNFIT